MHRTWQRLEMTGRVRRRVDASHALERMHVAPQVPASHEAEDRSDEAFIPGHCTAPRAAARLPGVCSPL